MASPVINMVSSRPRSQSHVQDHRVSHKRGLSAKHYPKDCPPLSVQWFFAVDVPKRKPRLLSSDDSKTPEPAKVPPKKFSAFSDNDSQSIEAAFQNSLTEDLQTSSRHSVDHDGKSPTTEAEKSASITVPVNEDFLFDVNIDERELAPVYWLGPVYDVRRGSWFQADGSTQKPCDENLAAQLEEGYLKGCPWRLKPINITPTTPSRPTSSLGLRNKSIDDGAKAENVVPADNKTAVLGTVSAVDIDANDVRARDHDENTSNTSYRLFGPYSNSVVTFQDSNTAYITTDDFLSRMSGTVYQRFAGGSHFSGTKVTRGYTSNPGKRNSIRLTKDFSPDKTSDAKMETSSSTTLKTPVIEQQAVQPDIPSPVSEEKRRTLERHMSSLVESIKAQDPAQQEEEARRQSEREIRDDYKETKGDDQGRSIEHLLLVTHGIGQRLGLRMETVNFVHDVNALRKTLKSVYSDSNDLQALNSELDSIPKNCRIQCIPVNWRSRLDFPRTSLKHNLQGTGVGNGDDDEQEYPTLETITVEGVPAVRNLLTDLALDILLYQSPIYREHITKIIVEECNRIFHIFQQRNPSFDGKVSFVGHSLGSTLMWDILCQQPTESNVDPSPSAPSPPRAKELMLDFEVEDFYALGSPIGLFQMLEGRRIASRQTAAKNESPTNSYVSRPKCQQVFNIFHPTDPIGYRMEPLITTAMTSMKPQPLPYTKRGIFGAPAAQGLSGIGSRVGQSVSGLWSSLSSGLASSLLTRSLGLTTEDEAKLRNQTSAATVGSPRAEQTIAVLDESVREPIQRSRSGTNAPRTGEPGQHPPTLLDAELETLYAGFQKQRSESLDVRVDDPTVRQEAEMKAAKLKREESKMRALNTNGRVDYSIQEGAFGLSLIGALASHLSYWSDEDVSHFMISQLLSRQRIIKKKP